MTYDNTNRGALSKNNRRENDKHPEYTGSINVAGHDYWISAWVKDGKNGKFFSLSVKRKDGTAARPDSASRPAPDARQAAPLDDEIPF